MSRTVGIRLAVAAVVLLVGGLLVWKPWTSAYTLRIVMPTADGTFVGGKVTIGGEDVGTITGLGVLNKQALVTISIDGSAAPLHTGTQARINWESVVGGRVIDLLPGSTKNPPLASGQMIVSTTERVELDQVFAMLDAPTRRKVQTLITSLNATLHGNEPNLRATIASAGPTINALGAVMSAIGQDGPAIQNLISHLHAMTSVIAEHNSSVSATIEHLDALTSALASEQDGVAQTLAELPATINSAQATLSQVPGAVSAAVPLLQDLRPATAQLPETARNLSPVLQMLRPTVADLRPTLASARAMLGNAPGFLDTSHQTLPGITTALTSLAPALSFLRPYTPELTGWISNWASLFASQTSGNYARLLIPEGATSIEGALPSLPPGVTRDPTPAPGSITGQPWTDANGDPVR